MRNENSRARPFAAFPKRLVALAALMVAGALLLGSSVCYDGDLSHEFSQRWHKGRGWTSAEWTPDGSRIVLGHAGGIYVVEADGTELTSLSGSYEPLTVFSKTAEIDFSPTLSPDGSRAAYATLRYAKGELREHTYEIAVQSLDGSDRVRLTENGRDDIAPSWSPDGSRIAIASPYGRDDMRIYTIAPDGSDEREIVPATLAAQCCELAWSPDGGRLAFLVERSETGSVEWEYMDGTFGPLKREVEVIPEYEVRRQSLYTVNADGSGLVKQAWSENPNSASKKRFGSDGLSAAEEAVSVFQWSPDGKRIVFVARRYGEKDGIYIADAEGASVRRIFDLATVEDSANDVEDSILEIAWSPDGSRIEFVAGRLAYFVRADWHPIADAYSVSDDGADLRILAAKDMDDYLRWHERVGGSGPKRIVTYPEIDNANVGPELKGWVLSTTPWGESNETVLVKIVNNRLTAVDPAQAVDVECSKAVPQARATTRTTRGQRTSGLMEDCRTLLEIKNTLAYEISTGDLLFNWSGYRPISEWRGITVEDGRVSALEYVLATRSLRGAVSPQIAELTELRTLHIRHNELEGEIPPELGRLSKLESLYIGGIWDGQDGDSRLSGRIPPELGSLSKLRFLDLSANELHGEIPPELGELSNLESLYLGDNELSGEIPPELGGLSNLKVLDLWRNDLEGEIPPELVDNSSLAYVNLIENDRLTGCVPPKWGHSWDIHTDLPICDRSEE